ncbi:MAG: asparagine synthase (glutamine-hydrolyzing) [Kiritimatiellae bacterium]|nr:asparagine synthase (glutamine-hydrolyzing) [Kiritimatiellia bacterium]
MCGICGFWRETGGPGEEQALDAMLAALAHRGPDDRGVYLDEQVALGHHRLSIIDLSERGRQPMVNEDESVWLVFNGQIYNYRALRAELETRGHAFRSHTDTEVILHGYEEYGAAFLERMNGMFAFAVWDKPRRRLFLARDRLGLKPLYYSESFGAFAFASEAKAFHRLGRPEIDEAALAYYFVLNYIPGEQTARRGVKELLPGHYLVYDGRAARTQRYWQIPWDRTETDLTVARTRVRELLDTAVEDRLHADVPVGTMLSGGVDSGSVAALAAGKHADLHTYTVGFHDRDDELAQAREVVQAARTTHREFMIETGDVAALLDDVVYHADEPLAESGIIAYYLAARTLSTELKVVLIGEGSDEVFAGYPWHRAARPPYCWAPRPLLARAFRYVTSWRRAPVLARQPQALYRELFDAFRVRGRDFLTHMLNFEQQNLLPYNHFPKIDRATMAFGLEARAPFTDYRLVSYANGLPTAFKIAGGTNKRVLREAMARILPPATAQRRKRGFLVPVTRWLQTDLRDYARDTLRSPNAYTRQFCSRKELDRLLAGCPRGYLAATEWYVGLWRLLILEIWHRVFWRGGRNSEVKG